MIYSLHYLVLGAGLTAFGSRKRPRTPLRVIVTATRAFVGSTQSPLKCLPTSLSLGRKTTDSRSYHSPECDVTFKNAWNYTWSISL